MLCLQAFNEVSLTLSLALASLMSWLIRLANLVERDGSEIASTISPAPTVPLREERKIAVQHGQRDSVICVRCYTLASARETHATGEVHYDCYHCSRLRRTMPRPKSEY